MGVGVTERTETIVVFLSRRIPQRELNVLSIDLDIGDIVLEHGGNINLAGGTSDEGTNTLIPCAASTEGTVYAPPESPLD